MSEFRWDYSRHRLVSNQPVEPTVGKCQRCGGKAEARQWTFLDHPAAGDYQYWIIAECGTCRHQFGGTYTEAQAARFGADTEASRELRLWMARFVYALRHDAILPEDF